MTRRAESKRKWWVIVLMVVAFHLALLLTVRREYLDVFLHDVHAPSGARSSGAASFPDAIIAIQVDVEDAQREIPVEVAPTPSSTQTPTPTTQPPTGAGDGGRAQTVDLGDILGDAGQPREGGGTRRQEAVPPRPVEITWPETKRLKHCIGNHVDVRILVGEDGSILDVVPQSPDVEADCLDAAIAAARRIKFAPGRLGGKPAELWAQVRIDFQEKR